MVEFLKSYAFWIVVGLFLLVTLFRRGHGHAGGCCGMGSHHDVQNPGEEKKEG